MTLMEWVEVPFEVQKPQDGRRVDSYLASRLHRYSRSQVQRLIADGRVFLRGKPAKPSGRVAEGETVLIRYPRHPELPCPHIAFTILHEDDFLLVIDKPAQILCHPTDKIHNNTVTSVLKNQFQGLHLHLAHRLDRETSGVLLLSKDPKTARILTSHFTLHRVKKEYLALASGRISWKHKTVDAPIGKEDGEIKVRQSVGHGAEAITEFERLSSSASVSLVRARPRTGRLHQIRAHLAHLGHPVLGDKLYMGAGELYMKAVRKTLSEQDLEKLGAPRQMLHAQTLTLPHPATGRELRVQAPLPEDFKRIMKAQGLLQP